MIFRGSRPILLRNPIFKAFSGDVLTPCPHLDPPMMKQNQTFLLKGTCYKLTFWLARDRFLKLLVIYDLIQSYSILSNCKVQLKLAYVVDQYTVLDFSVNVHVHKQMQIGLSFRT